MVDNVAMSSQLNYRGYRFPPEIISHTVWLYYRFTLNLRDIEDLLAERKVIVAYESIRQWCVKIGLDYARRLRLIANGRRADRCHLHRIRRTARYCQPEALSSNSRADHRAIFALTIGRKRAGEQET